MAKANGSTQTSEVKESSMQSSLIKFKRKDRKFVLLKAKKPSKYPFHDLPFMASSKKCEAHYWDVPATGGYHGGYETGAALANAYLKYKRLHQSEPHTELSHIAESFMVRFEQEGGLQSLKRVHGEDADEGMDALRGQYIGFFNTLNYWLASAVRVMGGNLDKVSEQELLDSANLGLQFDSAAFTVAARKEAE